MKINRSPRTYQASIGLRGILGGPVSDVRVVGSVVEHKRKRSLGRVACQLKQTYTNQRDRTSPYYCVIHFADYTDGQVLYTRREEIAVLALSQTFYLIDAITEMSTQKNVQHKIARSCLAKIMKDKI